MAEREIDAATGIPTTGHEWDGVKELDNPLPKWWVMTYLVTIVVAIIYVVLYPSFPTGTGHIKGALGHTERISVEQKIAVAKEGQAQWLAQLAGAELDQISANPELLTFARQGGLAAFNTNCAGCHGVGGGGQLGKYPVLADDDWIWGGDLEAIHTTILYGIRSDHDEARISEMPAFGADEILSAAEIDAVADFVLALADGNADHDSDAGVLYAENCAACHGEQGEGLQELGGPKLNDFVWLYGDTKEQIVAQISAPQQGVMPAFGPRLDEATLRMLAVYVHSLGGGQ